MLLCVKFFAFPHLSFQHISWTTLFLVVPLFGLANEVTQADDIGGQIPMDIE